MYKHIFIIKLFLWHVRNELESFGMWFIIRLGRVTVLLCFFIIIIIDLGPGARGTRFRTVTFYLDSRDNECGLVYNARFTIIKRAV